MYALLQYSISAIQLLRGWFHLGINCPFLSWKCTTWSLNSPLNRLIVFLFCFFCVILLLLLLGWNVTSIWSLATQKDECFFLFLSLFLSFSLSLSLSLYLFSLSLSISLLSLALSLSLFSSLSSLMVEAVACACALDLCMNACDWLAAGQAASGMG